MIASEVLRIVRRRGSYLSAVLLGLAIMVAVVVYRAFRDRPDDGGTSLLDVLGGVGAIATITAVIVGALAGSYDTANGTMRYLVMTGVPRVRLLANRLAGTLIAVALACVPAIVVGIAGAIALPHSEAATVRDHAAAVWGYASPALIYAAVSVLVGSLLRSNGASIAVSLGLFLGGSIISALVATKVSATAGALLLPDAAGAVASLDRSAIPLAASFAVVVAWLAALAVAAAWRVSREEC